jgi:hypothetical protein
MIMLPSDALTVRKVETEADFKVFFEFPWTIYKDDGNWVPPLLSIRRALLDKKKNPAWEYLAGDYFIAWRGGQAVGTIAAFINPRHNETWDEQIGWFGCFECVNEQSVADALLNTAAEWVRAAGPYTAMRGPATFTCNDEQWGLLIENFSRPVLLMPYNPSYYPALIDNAVVKLSKVMDVESYWCDSREFLTINSEPLERYRRIANRAIERYGITFRKPDPKKLREELNLLRSVYEKAWEKNWGNVVPTDHEMDHLFADLKDYFDPELAIFVYVKGELAGFLLALPDMNEVVSRAHPQPSEPEILTLLKALWHWKIRPKMTMQRTLLFGVMPDYRRMGVDVVCFLKYFDQSVNGPYPIIDAGWILETNQGMRSLLNEVHAKLYKKYRIYQAAL